MNIEEKLQEQLMKLRKDHGVIEPYFTRPVLKPGTNLMEIIRQELSYMREDNELGDPW